GMISFECRGRRLTGRLIGGEFIRYQSRFPNGYGCRASIPAGPLIQAVRRGSPVAAPARPARRTAPPRQGGGVGPTARGARGAAGGGGGAGAAGCGGEAPATAFTPHYLLDGLPAAAAGSGPARPAADPEEGVPAPAAATIRLEFTSPAKPALITLAGGGEEA